MKKATKLVITLVLMLVMVLSMSTNAFAYGSVTYDGNAQKLIFTPGSDYSPTDLFDGLKGVMPGDKLTQKITIKNDRSGGAEVELYLRSLGAKEGSEEFLSKMSLRVTQEGNAELFHAPADQETQLNDWVYLGTFLPGAEVDLELTLEVPITMGNEYQEAIGYLDWQFKVEEVLVDIIDPPVPETVDNSNMVMYIGLLIVSGVALTVFLVRKKKENIKA